MSQPYEDNKKQIGLAFPMRVEVNGRLAACSYEDHVKQSLRSILLTAQGERVMRPDFGSGLNAYLFEGIDATTTSLIKRDIRNTIARFEPRVELLDVHVRNTARDPAVLCVELRYRIKSNNVSDQLVLSVRR
ncbi:MAG: GPW/gp25 family protein [Dehalococcoidia bacterium]|nr:GPW/gp25 family protein [Dehalococcoidia bacterium]